ncbi:MAG TPA: DUF1501 domain-containing protein, partial [Myxococcota bacterium]
MAFTRRDILRGTAMLGAGALLPSLALGARKARAQSAASAQVGAKRKLVLVLNAGGWDPTIALDPKPGLPLIDVVPGSVRAFGGVSIWSDATRPNVDAFFTKWAERTCVVNGVQVRSFVHTDCMKRMLTGSPSEITPDMGAIAAFELAPELPVPYLALGSFSRSGPLAAITGRAGTSNQLQSLVDPNAAYAPATGPQVPDFGLAPTDAQAGFVKQYLEAGAARAKATVGQRGYNKKRVDDYISSLDRGETLANFVKSGSSLGARGYTVDLNVQIPLAVEALKNGLSQTAMLQSGFAWDTHTKNDDQIGFHDGLFASLDTLCQTLDDEDMLDSTTIMVLSEMGRTPKVNADLGKDHWPVTSCMLIGAGVAGGRTIGGTTDKLASESLDLQTGAVDGNGKQLQSTNLVAGVLESVGVNPEPYLPG